MEYRCLVISDDFTSGDEFMQNLLGYSQNVRFQKFKHNQQYYYHHHYHRSLRNVVESREDDYFVHVQDKCNVASKKIISRQERSKHQRLQVDANQSCSPSQTSLTTSHLAPELSKSEKLYKERQQEREKEENATILTSSTTDAVETSPASMSLAPAIVKEHNALHVYAQRLTLPSPSMPSVNITLSLALLHEPHLLSRIIHPAYYAEDQRWRYRKQDMVQNTFTWQNNIHKNKNNWSSDAQISFHSPHALIFLFNPFHVPSLMSLRHVWINALSECRAIDEQIRMEDVKRKMVKAQHYGSSSFQPNEVKYNNGTRLIHTMSTAENQSMSTSNNSNASYSLLGNEQQQQQQQQEKLRKLQWMKNATITFNDNNSGKRNASSALPTILLIAHSFELLRESMESTPLIHLPSPIEIHKLNAQIGAVVYSELSYHWEDRIDELKLHIARACVGEYKDCCPASLEQVYFTRQESVSRGVAQLHQMDDMESESESESENESDDTECTAALRSVYVKEQCEPEQLKEKLEQNGKGQSEQLHEQHNFYEENSEHTNGDNKQKSNEGSKSDEKLQTTQAKKSTWTWRWHAQTGKVFYVHRPTATSTYKRPTDYDGKEPPMNCEQNALNDVKNKHEENQKDEQQLTAERKTHKSHSKHIQKKNVKEKTEKAMEQETSKAVEELKQLTQCKEENDVNTDEVNAEKTAGQNIINKGRIRELEKVIDKLQSSCAQVRLDITARQVFVQQHNKLVEEEQYSRYELIKRSTTELLLSMMQFLREINKTKEHYKTILPVFANKSEEQTKDIEPIALESEWEQNEKEQVEKNNDEKYEIMHVDNSSEIVTLKEVEELALNVHSLYLEAIKEIDTYTNKKEVMELIGDESRGHDDDNIISGYRHQLATLDKRQVSCEVAAMSLNAQMCQVEAEKEIEEDKLSTLLAQLVESTQAEHV